MDFETQLRVLQAAQGDPAKLALATVDLAYPTLPDAERAAIKNALEVAAIPHWFDEALLAELLQIPPATAATLFRQLRDLKVVEPFPARGQNAVNVHEATRLALRKAMAEDPQRDFLSVSQRLAAHFASDLTPAGHIEWIYHLICAAPEQAAAELEKLDCNWSYSAHPEDRQALAAALAEPEATGLAQGRARVWALLVAAWTRVERGEAAQLADEAREALSLAKNVSDLSAEFDARHLSGAVLEAQGKPTEALAAFEEYLAISQQLAEQDPNNAAWKRELAMAKCRVGDVLQAQGKPTEALAAFREYLAISQRLAEQDPVNVARQRELAVAYSRVGHLSQVQGRLSEAAAAFGVYLTISQRLAEQDPTNASWQREFAVGNVSVGDVLQAQGKLNEALAVFGEGLAITRRLAEQDPSHAGWQGDLATANSRVGDVLQAQGKLSEALAAFGEDLAISRRLAEQDPSNAGWQRDLAVTYSRVADVLRTQGKHEEASEVVRALEQMARMASQYADADRSQMALEFQLQALDIALALHKAAPENPSYGQTAAMSLFRAGERAHAVGNEKLANQCLAGCHHVLHGLVTAGHELEPKLMELYQQLNKAIGGPPASK